MKTKTITEEAEGIFDQAKKLKEFIEDPTLTINKIWVPGVGIVRLWEVKQD